MAPPADLDDAIAQLMALHEEVELKSKAIEERDSQLAERDQRIDQLRSELELLKRHVFGRRREKIDPNQLRLFAGDAVTEQEIEEASAPAEPTRRKKKGHGRGVPPSTCPARRSSSTCPRPSAAAPSATLRCSGSARRSPSARM